MIDFHEFHQNQPQFQQNQVLFSDGSRLPTISEYDPQLLKKMKENNRHHHHRRPSRLGLRNTSGGGKIVEVDGGHIIRSTSRKDRHSKVCTAKGPRDRRIRLSANTAIQFYDVQNRLGYDRPSKAVDWLIKKAKASIDELAELPAWKPTTDTNLEQNYSKLSELEEHPDDDIVDNYTGNVQDSTFMPASLDSIKYFFPTISSSTPASINLSFSQNPDLNLSVQSSQPPTYSGYSLQENGGINGSVFNSPVIQTTPFLRPLVGKPTNSQLLNYISQRRPLQSSNSPRVRARVDPLPFTGAEIHQDQTLGFHNPSVMSGFSSGLSGLSGFAGFNSGTGRFSEFNYPATIQSEEDEHDGISNKPSSASSDSCH